MFKIFTLRLVAFNLILMFCQTLAQENSATEIVLSNQTYPFYPAKLDTRPKIPSPFLAENGTETIIGFMEKHNQFFIMPVTVENGEPFSYKTGQMGKGDQLKVDADDFPFLAQTGFHAQIELDGTRKITDRSLAEINDAARPGRSSGAGFIAEDEDIISVFTADNRLVKKMGLTHPQSAKPLFHIWNIVRRLHIGATQFSEPWESVEIVFYNQKKVHLKIIGSRGWQESIFNDEILGSFHLEIWREIEADEEAFLKKNYPRLTDLEWEDFLKKLSSFHTGEMAPYYIQRYGFYEGHTEFRADPISIAFIFNLKNIWEIENAFVGKLNQILKDHFTAISLSSGGIK